MKNVNPAFSWTRIDWKVWSAMARWIVLGSVVGLLAGTASAFFLWLLKLATAFRVENEGIVFLLPLGGALIGWLYERYGQGIKGGNNLVLDTLHDQGPWIPRRMAPMVLFGTVGTHLFGGSAGREGTAVQMGASLADWVSKVARVGPDLRHQLLAAGIAGGFGSVFGTPIAGLVFGLESVVLGRLAHKAIVPALAAAVIGDLTCHAWGIGHDHYVAPAPVELDLLLCGKWLIFAAAMAAATTTFIELTRFIKQHMSAWFPRLPLRMFVGGCAVVGLWQVVGTSDYLGLGVPMIQQSFVDADLGAHVFALKLLFTAITLGAGYLGGEVTPLFFVGATLGSVLARWLGIPIELGAGVGLAAVFSSASNAPLALSIMAMELLGAGVFPHVAIVCVVSYVLTGHRGIYTSQLVLETKDGAALDPPRLLGELRGAGSADASVPDSEDGGPAPER